MTLRCPNCGYVDPTPPRALTKRQAEILRFIERRIADFGFAPSQGEIAGRFDFQSLATVHEHLTNLERKGFIRRSYNEARSIQVLIRADDAGLPAGVPT
jgi:SOS-response transcriptional repressor LexA